MHDSDPSQAPPPPSSTERRNARLGLILFAIYCAGYAGFVGICAFSLETMETPVFGVNLAIVYGFALIGFAFVLALAYTWLCKREPEREGAR